MVNAESLIKLLVGSALLQTAVSLTLSKSQCARAGATASSLGMGQEQQPVHMESIAVDVVLRGARSSHFRYTRYPRYTGHRITKISSSQWSSHCSMTGMGKGLCCGHGICPAQCWKPHHAQSCIGFPEVCKRCHFSVLSNCTMDLHPKN